MTNTHETDWADEEARRCGEGTGSMAMTEDEFASALRAVAEREYARGVKDEREACAKKSEDVFRKVEISMATWLMLISEERGLGPSSAAHELASRVSDYIHEQFAAHTQDTPD